MLSVLCFLISSLQDIWDFSWPNTLFDGVHRCVCLWCDPFRSVFDFTFFWFEKRNFQARRQESRWVFEFSESERCQVKIFRNKQRIHRLRWEDCSQNYFEHSTRNNLKSYSLDWKIAERLQFWTYSLKELRWKPYVPAKNKKENDSSPLKILIINIQTFRYRP